MKVESVPFKIKKTDFTKKGPVIRWTSIWGKMDEDGSLSVDTTEYTKKPTNAELQETAEDDGLDGWELLTVLQVTK